MKLEKWVLYDSEEDFPKASLLLRLNNLTNNIENYLSDTSEDKLHEVRIDIKRMRYSMEVFYSYFRNDDYYRFYKKMKKLQDETGVIRDIDVIKNLLEKRNRKKILKKRNKLEKMILKDLKSLSNSKVYLNFLKTINNYEKRLSESF